LAEPEPEAATRLQPLTRLLLLLILAPVMTSLPAVDLLVATALLFAGYRWSSPQALQRLRFGIARLRWLLLSIFVLYLGFTPGTPLASWLPGLSWEGLAEGGRRVMVLLCLITAVYWLLVTTPVPSLVGAFSQLLRPLTWVGVPVAPFTRRLALTLSAIDGLEARYRSLHDQGQRSLSLAVAWITDLEQAPPAADDQVSMPAWPAVWEWGLLLIVLVLAVVWPR